MSLGGVPVWSGVIAHGELKISDKRYSDWLASMEGKRVECIVRRPRRKRSLAQDRYYRGCILPLLVEHIGCSTIEIHTLLKCMFLVPLGIDSMADLDFREDTRELSTMYIEFCISFAAELGVVIPPATRVWV